MAYRKTYIGLSAIKDKFISLPIGSLLDLRNDLDKYLNIFTENTDLYESSWRKFKYSYEDKIHIIQVIIWMNFESAFRTVYPNNYAELCPRFNERSIGPGSTEFKIDVMVRFGPGDSVEEFEKCLEKFYHIDRIVEGG